MSTLNVSNITDGTTTVGTSYVVNGSAKMWCQWDNTGTFTPKETFNTSSLTDTAAGRTTIAISSNMSNGDYSSQAQSCEPGASATLYVGNIDTQTASSIEMRGRDHSGSSTTGLDDNSYNAVVSFGDLA
jgi:hypothetical protein